MPAAAHAAAAKAALLAKAALALLEFLRWVLVVHTAQFHLQMRTQGRGKRP